MCVGGGVYMYFLQIHTIEMIFGIHIEIEVINAKALTRCVSKLSGGNLNINILLGCSFGRIFKNKEPSGAMA